MNKQHLLVDVSVLLSKRRTLTLVIGVILKYPKILTLTLWEALRKQDQKSIDLALKTNKKTKTKEKKTSEKMIKENKT